MVRVKTLVIVLLILVAYGQNEDESDICTHSCVLVCANMLVY